MGRPLREWLDPSYMPEWWYWATAVFLVPAVVIAAIVLLVIARCGVE